ncbi:MAG: type III pantothenate kinase [Nitrospirota bacterium]
MLIAIDIGNSSINIGYFMESGLIVQKIKTIPLKKVNEYSLILSDFFLQNHLEKRAFDVIISSVVQSHTSVFKNVFEKLLNNKDKDILIVSHRMNTGLKFKINSPEELGTDRIANAVGAYESYKNDVAVVDFGTATTITVVDKDANYIGGSIMPGIGLMNDMLDKGTSKLKKAVLTPPLSALGADTSGCICSGLYYGTAGAVERILDEIEAETCCRFKVVVTGGYGAIMGKFIKRPHSLNANLTLEGLRILYEKNRSS